MPHTKFRPGQWQSGGIASHAQSGSSISRSAASQATQTGMQASQASTHDIKDENTFASEGNVDISGSIFGSSPRTRRDDRN
ncbi:hypothetical protein I312_106641 [Cryptococcus bacillisporus CA1280]|uniref:uncharacterized protein n=1 Tax=Cryptococcus bacillisporus CA1280 TaxID=1296109 RepID=UPI003366700B